MKGIVIAFAVFALFIGTLTIICVRQDVSLVSANYYQDELGHQAKMDQQNNLSKLKEYPKIELTHEEIKIIFPFLEKIEKGKMRLLRPSNSKLDQQFELNNQSEQSFNLLSGQTGLYRVTIQWSMEGKEYYYEKLMVL